MNLPDSNPLAMLLWLASEVISPCSSRPNDHSERGMTVEEPPSYSWTVSSASGWSESLPGHAIATPGASGQAMRVYSILRMQGNHLHSRAETLGLAAGVDRRFRTMGRKLSRFRNQSPLQPGYLTDKMRRTKITSIRIGPLEPTSRLCKIDRR